jgi:predicted amidohydrolase YtcJ
MCDLLFVNANVITMDPAQPAASLVAIRGDRIVAVSDPTAIGQWRSPGTQIINCAGKPLIPGFIDAHCHVHAYAESLVSLNISPRERINSISDIQNRIRDFCRNCPPGTWVRAKGYNEFYLEEGRHPDRRDLDVAAPLHPVKLTHRSGHAHVLNSLALKQAGITVETGDPPEGFIDRELGTGEPTGILFGMGKYLAGRIPFIGDEEIAAGLAQASAKLLECGVTSVQDVSSANDRNRYERYQSWKERGLFRPRVNMIMGFDGFSKGTPGFFNNTETGTGPTGVKIILGQVSGSLYPCQDELNENVAAIHAAGLQAIIHAVEEPEVEAACNAIAYALRRQLRPDHRHRIEHCSVCPPSLMRRIAELGITIVTQPSFIYFNGERYLKTVAADQLGHLYAIGAMIKHDLHLGFSSDFPVSDPNPMIGIEAAVARLTDQRNPVNLSEKISVSDALRAYTRGAAWACFEDEAKGSITEGKLADLVMLDGDPRTTDPGLIHNIRPAMTVLGGQIVWDRTV